MYLNDRGNTFRQQHLEMSRPRVSVAEDGLPYNSRNLMQTFEIQESEQLKDRTLIDWMTSKLADKRRAARACFIMGCIVFSTISVLNSTWAYFEYETGVAVRFEELQVLRQSLPGITICNKNLISKEEALKKENVPGLEMSLKYLEKSIRNVSENDASFATLRADQKKREIEIWEDYMSAYYGKLPVLRQVKHGPKLDRFLINLSCNRKGWPEVDPEAGKPYPSPFECEKSKWINTAQGKGNCITLFHAATQNATQELMFKTDKRLPSAKERDFVPLEVVKMLFDFGPENYTDLRLEAGGEIMFHDNRTIPLEASLSYTLRPGHNYKFHLKKSITKSLPAPFASNCTNYFGQNWHEYAGDDETSIRTKRPLSRTHCIELCVIEKITKANKCWPKEIPFLAKGTPDHQRLVGDSDEGILWCHRQNLKVHEREQMYHNFVRANRQCSEICGKDCLRDYFETIFQGIDWPSTEAINVHSDDQTRKQMKVLRGCCALVSVLYSSHMVQISQIYAKTELVSFLAEVGGTISMWVGISMLSTYTLIELLVNLCSQAKRSTPQS